MGNNTKVSRSLVDGKLNITTVPSLMLSHIINETTYSYYLQSVLVEEGSFALSSILSLLVEASTLLLVVTISQSFIEIIVLDRPAAESIFLTSHGGSTIMELEWLVASGA